MRPGGILRPCGDQVSPGGRTVPGRAMYCRTAANSNTEHYLQQESHGHLAQLVPEHQKYLHSMFVELSH